MFNTRQVHVDQILSNVAINFRQEGFIADRIFPIVPVAKQSDIIKTYNQGDLWRVENDKRSPGTEANKINFQTGSDSYIAKNYALKTGVTIEERKNADAAFIRDLEIGRVEFTTGKLQLNWEDRVATQVLTTTNVSTAFTVASAWSDRANSDPFGDLQTALDTQEDATGYRPNRIVFSGLAWREVSRNNGIINKTKSTALTGASTNATQAEVANLLQVEEILVGGVFKNTAAEAITQSLSRIWGDNVLLYYAPSRPSIETPSFGYSFRWRAPGLPNWGVERHPYDQKIKMDEIEVAYYQDEKLTGTSFGTLITGINSSQ